MALDTEGKRNPAAYSRSVSPRSEDLDSSSAESSRMDDVSSPLIRSPYSGENSPAVASGVVVGGAGIPRHSLKFSIEKILSPEFGKGNNKKEDTLRTSGGSLAGCRTVSTALTSQHHNRQRRTTPAASENNKVTSAPKPRSAPVVVSSPETSQSPKPTTLPAVEDAQKKGPILWPAWVYCTRYSDRPSSGPGPRSRRMKKKEKKPDEKRPRTAFTAEQLARLKQEFQENRYLTEKRRQDLAKDLKLNESQIKIWFQNKRAKIKKASGQRNPLALQLMAQGLYNHSTVPVDGEGMEGMEGMDGADSDKS